MADGKGAKEDPAKQKAADLNSVTNRLNVFLQQGLLPLTNQLLQESDPIPFYAQRILSAILDRNFSFVKLLREMGPGHTPSGKALKGLI